MGAPGAGRTPEAAVSSADVGAEADAGATEASEGGAGAGGSAVEPQRNLIALENARPGTSAWQLELPAYQHEVEGYASAVSARAGERIQLHVNVDRARAVHYELYRMGYYQGFGGRFISSAPSRMLSPQVACPADPTTGLVECAWDSAFDVDIADSWVSGQYYFKLITEDGVASYVPLIVRETTPRAAMVVQISVTTWQAYNLYGGSSLYRNFLPQEFGYVGPRAHAVSFDRPYTCQGAPGGSCRPGSGDYELGERWLIEWLEQRGVEIAYVSNLDVDSDSELLKDRKLFVSVGHDEYWTIGERTALESARDRGVSLAFLSANTGYWRVRIAASSTGAPRRTVVCYKDPKLDPTSNASDTTHEFRYEPHPRPEHTLIGVMYDDGISRTYFDGFTPVVTRADHWLYAGTGLRNGDYLTHVVGYEWDHAFPADAPATREIIAHEDLFNVDARPLGHDMSVYYPTDHSFVFGAGSIFWARALSMPETRDARVGRMTENMLRRAGIAVSELPNEPSDNNDPTTYDNLSEVIAGTGESGTSDGPSTSATFAGPVGLALDPDGSLYVTDSAASSIRKISNDGQVTTLAGCGHNGPEDGIGTAACFRFPTGIVRAQDGTLYIADTGNNKLRALSPDGAVRTLAGDTRDGHVDHVDPLQARFVHPRGLALDEQGVLYIADQDYVRKLHAGGVSTLTEGVRPTGIALASDGSLYMVRTRDAVIDRVLQGQVVGVTGLWGRFGDADGSATQAQMRAADGIALDGEDVIFADTLNHKLRRWSGRDGMSTIAGGHGSTRELFLPRGVLVTQDSYIVADTGNHRVVRIRKQD